MHDSIVIKIPSKYSYFKLIRDAIKDIGDISTFSKQDTEALIEATRELVANAIEHAYAGKNGYIEVSIHPFETGVRIDVHDWGIPMSGKKHKSVPLDPNASKGFNRIYRLTDRFEYKNLGKEGKKFIVLKYASRPIQKEKNDADKETHFANRNAIAPKTPVIVRDFREGDEEGISRLIYRNYGHSYIKDTFYYPQKIAAQHGKKFYSVVAESEGKIVGHFAFVLIPESTIAEIGIVVVDPLFQGKGIMNRMMERILQKAKEVNLDAVFGEAIMYHIFSQKSNLKHGFYESALMLGKTPADITIENNELTKMQKRGAVLIGYKFFNRFQKSLYLPKIYKKQIIKTYENARISWKKKTKHEKNPQKHLFLHYTFDPPTNVATIRIDKYGKDFKQKFLLLVEQLRAKHCDMIYADISLEEIPRINKVVKILNKRGFFYCGIVFLLHEKKDYLRLQLKNSDKVGTKNYVCYSDFCKTLSEYIRLDEKRCKGLYRRSV